MDNTEKLFVSQCIRRMGGGSALTLKQLMAYIYREVFRVIVCV